MKNKNKSSDRGKVKEIVEDEETKRLKENIYIVFVECESPVNLMFIKNLNWRFHCICPSCIAVTAFEITATESDKNSKLSCKYTFSVYTDKFFCNIKVHFCKPHSLYAAQLFGVS